MADKSLEGNWSRVHVLCLTSKHSCGFINHISRQKTICCRAIRTLQLSSWTVLLTCQKGKVFTNFSCSEPADTTNVLGVLIRFPAADKIQWHIRSQHTAHADQLYSLVPSPLSAFFTCRKKRERTWDLKSRSIWAYVMHVTLDPRLPLFFLCTLKRSGSLGTRLYTNQQPIILL